ncbi:MAG: VWA domain-containing protein [Clostridia bacterium]|nr:VWA domain-containing protein [Clostridia bacterium]
MDNKQLSTARKKSSQLENRLKRLLANGQGMRLGETAVISTKVHANDGLNPGIIQILPHLDAGCYYLKADEPDRYLHLDVFHQPGQIDPVFLGRRIWLNLSQYFAFLKRETPVQISEQQWMENQIAFACGIIVATETGHGDVYQLASNTAHTNQRPIQNHVHILARIPSGYYDFLISLVDAVETGILRQGYEIRKVEALIHRKQGLANEAPKVTIPLPKELTSLLFSLFRYHNQSQAAMKLAFSLGSLEEAAQLMETLTPTKNIYLGRIRYKNPDLNYVLQELIEAGLVKKGKLFYTLTGEGKELLGFLRSHQRELEVEINKTIRKKPLASPQHTCQYNSRLKARKKLLIDRRKVMPLSGHRYGPVAVPETVIRAAVRGWREGRPGVKIETGDIRVYSHKSYAPIDTCLLIDCSGSMVGEKIKAVSRLAEHLVLTSREKVSIVKFQEMDAQIVVPFTKNHKDLQLGLRSILPEGLTPLAKGINQAVTTIVKSRARNPLLVIITDGLPNYPLWTRDAQADALKAAEIIPANKIRCIIIGLKPDEKYLRSLAYRAEGNLYIIDSFKTETMVDIIYGERADYSNSRRIYR